MSKERIRTKPNLSLASEVHMEAIKNGDDHYRMWQRNLVDEFKELPEDKIKETLQSRSFPFAVCFENWCNDFNLASGFRNANAFNAKELFYVGDKKFDRRGMCGVHNYMDIKFLPTIEELIALKSKYTFIGVDNYEGAKPLDDYQWKPDSLIIFGSEHVGITPGMLELCDELVYIKQYGSIRSLNAATASGIIMNDFVTKYNKGK